MSKIIKSLLDTDFYTFTQMQAIFHKYTGVNVEYAFKWRNWKEMHLNIPLKDFAGRLKEQLDALCELRFTEDELAYLEAIPFIKKDFIEYLRLFKLNRSHIRVSVENEQLKVAIKGPWLNTIPFETPVLAIISQLYTEHNGTIGIERLTEGRKRLKDKVDYIKTNLHHDEPFLFSEFGTRRRASLEWQEEVLDYLIEHAPQYLVGTSNVYFAKKKGIKFVGTMSHQWLQAHQQLDVRLIDSQSKALQVWAEEYRGELGIALSDVITFDAFLVDFDRYFALLYDGCRHDSGNPFSWGEKLIAHYTKLRIDSKTKTGLFSDGLNFQLALTLYRTFVDRLKTAFGIGTNLTNDIGFTAPQIVIKIVYVNGKPVAKVPDSAGKGMCEDQGFLTYLKQIITQKTGNTGVLGV